MDGSKGSCEISKPKSKDPPKAFTFDGAYFVDSTTETIYNDIGYPLVDGVLEGYNGTIFAYGQTGCGKSFSMQGITDPPTQRGIIPRAFEHIFENIQVAENVKYLVRASYLEIYNEEIRDLLGKDHKHRLDLKEHPDKGVYIKDLSMHTVHNTKECEHVMELGWKNRSVGATLMNADSSRSHSIFTIHIEMCDLDENGQDHIRAGKLNLVDLAGSERQTKTGATGDRLKEATKINLSLSALGNVISALVDGKSKHIPYRDSKLTRLLQDSLGGNTKTLMVACLSPADNNYDETLSTLRYANRAKNIKNKPKINEDPKDALLRQFQEEIKQLKAMLMGQIPIPQGGFEGVTGGAPAVEAAKPDVAMTAEIEAEKERLKEEYETKLKEMQEKYEEQQSSKAKLQVDIDQMKEYYEGRLSALEMDKAAESQPSSESKSEVSSSQSISVTSVVSDQVQGTDSQELIDRSTPDVVPRPEVLDQEGGMLPAEGEGEKKTGPTTPRASPTLPRKDMASMLLDQEEALKRLQQLEHEMVGGERATDEGLKEKRRKKLKHAEVRKLQLAKAIAKMDDEGIMLNIYSSIEEELKVKNELLEKEKEKVHAAECEIADLNAEFEFERIDYLDTIRKQEKQLALYQQLLEKVQPVLRRDCNYYNLDKVKSSCVWDEEEQSWQLPDLVVTKDKLPDKLPPGAVMQGGRPTNTKMHQPRNGYMNGSSDLIGPRDFDEEDKYLQRLSRSDNDEKAMNYFKPKRANQLLGETDMNKNHHDPAMHGVMNGYTNDKIGPSSHAQKPPADMPLRRPMRLEALPTGKSKKGKKKGHNTLEPL